jgi:hypothetical protein
MTDRINALTVVLEQDYREDDAESLISAIKLLRGVISVEKNVTDLSDHVAEQRAQHELRAKLIKLIS